MSDKEGPEVKKQKVDYCLHWIKRKERSCRYVMNYWTTAHCSGTAPNILPGTANYFS